MKKSPYQTKKIENLKNKAVVLYRQGLTTREVGKIVSRSRTWVAEAVRDK